MDEIHNWGPWDQHMYDEWGHSGWWFYRKCLDCPAQDTAPSYSLCGLRALDAGQLAARTS